MIPPNAGRLELPGHLNALGDQGQASLNNVIDTLSLKEKAGQVFIVREISQNRALTSELLKRTADLHAQAVWIDQKPSVSLAQVERATSGLPDRLSRLTLQVDDLSREASVLKSLSVDSSISIELTSKAMRHLLKGRVPLVDLKGKGPLVDLKDKGPLIALQKKHKQRCCWEALPHSSPDPRWRL